MANQNRMRHAAALCAGLLAGCAVGPDYHAPVLDVPEQWPAQSAESKPTTAAGDQWWRLYGDPVLDQMMDEALAHNTDLRVAAARVLEAHAQAGLADADRAPVVSAQASGNRSGSSQRGTMPLPAGTPRVQNTYRATLDVSYELDFWGKYHRSSEAARADLLAAEYNQHALRLTLAADVVQQYAALLAADAQKAVVRRVLDSRGETTALMKKRLAGGAVSEYDVRQAEAEEAFARAQLASAEQAQERQEAVLAVLLGRAPREVMTGHVVRGAPAAQSVVWVPAGLPSALLLRRPDVQEAEQQLVAANARIGAARAQLFPSITLTGFLGSESTDLSDLFSGPAGIFRFAAAAVQPIFNAGRTRHAEDAANARRDQALAQYQRAVANAFRDVRLALAAQDAARQVAVAETQRAEALRLAQEKAVVRNQGGVASRLEVLDADRQLLQAQLNRIDAERAQRAAVADLFKALGGGWPDTSARAETQ